MNGNTETFMFMSLMHVEDLKKFIQKFNKIIIFV
jgi:hypothetical protein